MPSIMASHRPSASGAKTVEKDYSQCCCNQQGGMGKKILLTLVGILIVYVIFLVGSMVRNDMKKFYFIGKADKMEHTIVVNGYGKVTGQNDIAVTNIGYSNTNKDVAKAQADNKKVMDQIMDELKKLGVAEKDLQTSYSIYPDYNYTQQKGQELVGYRVSNQVSVKIRDLSKIPSILGLAGKYGATEVGGLNFTIDDSENLKAAARAEALTDAKAKAQVLADSLGVRLADVVNYNEYESANYYEPAFKTMAVEGGGMDMVAPATVASGSKDVIMNNNITFEIVAK